MSTLSFWKATETTPERLSNNPNATSLNTHWNPQPLPAELTPNTLDNSLRPKLYATVPALQSALQEEFMPIQAQTGPERSSKPASQQPGPYTLQGKDIEPRKNQQKSDRPDGEVGRPGRGGFNLEQALGWDKKTYSKAKVSCVLR